MYVRAQSICDAAVWPTSKICENSAVVKTPGGFSHFLFGIGVFRLVTILQRQAGLSPASVESTMVGVPKRGSQDQWSNGRRNPVAQLGGRASAAPYRLR